MTRFGYYANRLVVWARCANALVIKLYLRSLYDVLNGDLIQ